MVNREQEIGIILLSLAEIFEPLKRKEQPLQHPAAEFVQGNLRRHGMNDYEISVGEFNRISDKLAGIRMILET